MKSIEDLLDDLPAAKERDFQLYCKVGLFCNMSPEEFNRTPIWFKYKMSQHIDSLMEPYIAQFGEGSEEGLPPISYFHLAIMLALGQLFGGSGDK